MIKLEKKKTRTTICQTIRFDGELYDLIQDIAYENEVSFNSAVNQLLFMLLKGMKGK